MKRIFGRCLAVTEIGHLCKRKKAHSGKHQDNEGIIWE